MMDAVTIPHEPAAADGLALTTEVVDDRRAFLRLEPDWNRLLRAGAAQTPFLTWEWLHSWWTHLGHAGRLNIIVVRQGDEMVAIAPLTTIGLWPRPFSRTRFLGWGQAGSDYLDLLVQPGFERAAANAVARVLAASGHSLILDHLAPGASAAFLRAPLTAAGWSIHESVQDCCPFIPLAGHTWDSYLGSLGPAHRANVRRRLRALEHEFPVAFALVPPHERLATLDRLAWFHERRWMARGGSSAFSTIPLRAFHADASRRMSERGWLRLYALRLDGVTVAAMYGFF
jgi:CelD/BcsL family acetyltransferase involved in cellulose biosynthesis